MDIHISIAPETLFMVGPIHVTNSLLTMFIVMALLLISGAAIARNAKLVPGRWQGIFEVVAAFILELVESTGGKSFGRKIFPLVGAIFIFIAVANYSGVLPGVGTIGFYHTEPAAEPAPAMTAGEAVPTTTIEGAGVVVDAEHADEPRQVLVPLFRAPNADLNMTLAMALVTFTTVQVLGVRAHGAGGRLKHMADPVFLFPIEIISEFGRIISLSARLFGNVFAGEVLLGVMYTLVNAIKIAIVPLLVPVVFIFLELLFGTIQALVFALLTAVYITLAAGDHGPEHDDGHATGTGAHHEPDTGVVAPAPAAAGD
ncbi:MAG: F0F1 ATP synthase subunit A [Thermomicrobiales bacterium]|nr:F0F1 ATP synthase subunit A [Thermomicrobiales bacterium]